MTDSTASLHGAQPEPSAAEPSAAELVVELTRMIAHDLDVRIEERDIEPTMPLLDGGLMLDSMVLFELITLVEQRYGVTFPGENLSPEIFANLTVLAEHILAMRARA